MSTKISVHTQWERLTWHAYRGKLWGLGTKPVVATEILVVIAALPILFATGMAGLIIAGVAGLYWVYCQVVPRVIMDDSNAASHAKELNSMAEKHDPDYVARCEQITGEAVAQADDGASESEVKQVSVKREIAAAVRSLRSIKFDGRTITLLRMVTWHTGSMTEDQVATVREIAATITALANDVAATSDPTLRKAREAGLREYAAEHEPFLREASAA